MLVAAAAAAAATELSALVDVAREGGRCGWCLGPAALGSFGIDLCALSLGRDVVPWPIGRFDAIPQLHRERSDIVVPDGPRLGRGPSRNPW